MVIWLTLKVKGRWIFLNHILNIVIVSIWSGYEDLYLNYSCQGFFFFFFLKTWMLYQIVIFWKPEWLNAIFAIVTRMLYLLSLTYPFLIFATLTLYYCPPFFVFRHVMKDVQNVFDLYWSVKPVLTYLAWDGTNCVVSRLIITLISLYVCCWFAF